MWVPERSAEGPKFEAKARVPISKHTTTDIKGRVLGPGKASPLSLARESG